MIKNLLAVLVSDLAILQAKIYFLLHLKLRLVDLCRLGLIAKIAER